MKIRLLLITMLMGMGMVFAQSPYKLVTIHDIQYIDSVNTKGDVSSPLNGDTVRVRGVVMVRPVVDPTTDRRPILWTGSRWQITIEDTTGRLWEGLNVVQNDTSTEVQGTFFDVLDTAQVVEITGVVDEYYTTTQLNVLTNPVTQVNIIGQLSKRPDPIKLSVTDFMKNGQLIKDAEKYEGMYIEIDNVISSDRNTSSGGFNINDGNGNHMVMYPQSGYFKTDSHKLTGVTNYDPPQDGTPINFIRGILSTRTDGYYIAPIYPGDINITATPPIVSNILRDTVQVKTDQAVTISAKIKDLDGYVKNAFLHYRVGNNDRTVIEMQRSNSDTTLYSATIPGINSDSTLVDYFISAKDNDGLMGFAPSDTVTGNYFYQVLNEKLTIRDIQYSPFGSGYSSYNGYKVTLTGVVTADTSDIPGFGSGTPLRVYMQEGSGPWSGIMIGTSGLKGPDILKFKKGDNVTLSGVIDENYGVTQIDSLTDITVNSHDNNLPEAFDLTTGDIDKKGGGDVSAEQWESVLVDYKNVTVTDENADGDIGPISTNHGEIFVDDGSGDARVELQDGNHNYHNDWDSTLFDNPANKYVATGSKFSEIKGILYYSYSYYKLVPRKNEDLSGFVTDVKKQPVTGPASYSLEQNYPNPFNPSTVISYSIPKGNTVTLKIFNVLGQEVKTLVNDYRAPGKYTVNFNASNLSSGIYFYTLHAGSYFQVKKMMLLK